MEATEAPPAKVTRYKATEQIHQGWAGQVNLWRSTEEKTGMQVTFPVLLL